MHAAKEEIGVYCFEYAVERAPGRLSRLCNKIIKFEVGEYAMERAPRRLSRLWVDRPGLWYRL